MISTKFDDYLKKTWQELFESKEGQELFRSGFKFLHLQPLEKGYLAFFNTAYTENKRETQIDFGLEEIRASDSGEEQKQEDSKPEDTKVVLKDFDETKFNYNQVEPSEILFYVDLENEAIVTKEKANEINEDGMLDGNEMENEISQSEYHPVLANISPVGPNHALLPLYSQEELPQVVGSDIIMLLLQIFKLSEAEDLKIGFNSTGAFAHVNHLHFHLVYASELFKDGKFPIENAKRTPLLKSSLQHSNEELNMYNVGIKIEELEGYPIKGFVISPSDTSAEIGDIFSSVSFAAGALTNILIEMDIPHNLLIAERGLKVYIIPRKFEKEFSEFSMQASWLEIAGLIVLRSKKAFQSVTVEAFERIMSEEVSLDQELYDSFKQKATELFKKNYS